MGGEAKIYHKADITLAEEKKKFSSVDALYDLLKRLYNVERKSLQKRQDTCEPLDDCSYDGFSLEDGTCTNPNMPGPGGDGGGRGPPPGEGDGRGPPPTR